MKSVLILLGGTACLLAHAQRVYQPLHIPEALSGKEFKLDLHEAKRSFWKGATTKTYAYNNESFWGPTLFLTQGETVKIDVKNSLGEPTTTHWHGLHLPAVMDGGPHQVIAAGTTWSPTFKVMNHAGTYWYHPHVHEATQKQLTYGAGGLIIVGDPEEAKLKLPRTYGVDDIPLVFTSRRFYKNNEFSFEGDNDKYGDYLLANGTMDAEVKLPKQLVRLRILNAEIERGYTLGFKDDRTFYVIATDGGLVNKPIPLKRMKLMTGERVEILVDLSHDQLGSSLDLMSFNSGQPFGYPGAEPGTGRPNGGYINNIDFPLLHIKVSATTHSAITELPVALTTNHFYSEAEVSQRRKVQINGGRPTFYFDDHSYKMHETNQFVKLGAVEEWTVQNTQIFGHAFHIHDVQFKLVARSNGPVEPWEDGWKDTVYVPINESVTFIAKFDDFASEENAYMYHCHMSNHEDGGLMGEFKVVKDPMLSASRSEVQLALHNKATHPVTTEMLRQASLKRGRLASEFSGFDTKGQYLSLKDLSRSKPVVLFFIEASCPCSRDASKFLSQLQSVYKGRCTVIGVIDSDATIAKKWAQLAQCTFRLFPDAHQSTISGYQVPSSVYSILIAPGGRIERTYPGYSQSMLKELNSRVALLSGTAPKSLSVQKAPKQLTTGCRFAGSAIAVALQ